jgi:hypothetical protein
MIANNHGSFSRSAWTGDGLANQGLSPLASQW